VIEKEIEIRTPDGVADGVLWLPNEVRQLPGVLDLTDIGGIRPATREMGRRLAGAGYVVLMPNLFYRTARPPVFEGKGSNGEEWRRKRMAELMAPLTPEALDRDLPAYVDLLVSHLSSGSDARIGVVGHCFSGGVAMRCAAVRPDKVAAVASFHGGKLFTDALDSPHRLLPRIKAQLYFGHAIEDRSMPEKAIRDFERALSKWGGKYKSETYEGAHHGWTAPDSPVYNKPQAERAFQEMLSLFEQTLQ
jgi:carboxymethylenebutenolidase